MKPLCNWLTLYQGKDAPPARLGGRLRLRLEFKLADCWVGVFARHRARGWEAWVCVVPCLPVHVIWTPSWVQG